MAITKLPVNFKDDVIDTSVSDRRRYNLITNSDGTISLEDVTTYEQIGSNFGAIEVNKTNGTVNDLIDNVTEEKQNIDVIKDREFILINQAVLEFSNKIATISDARITENSLADVYFTGDTIQTAEEADISVETENGKVVLTASKQPDSGIKATIKIWVV